MPYISKQNIEAVILKMTVEERRKQLEYAKKAKYLAWDNGDKYAYEQAIYKIQLLNKYIYG